MGSLSWRRVWQGIAFIVVLGILLGLTIVKFQQKFPWQSTVDVTLKTERSGTQLEKNADVKVRGIVVGRVKTQSSVDGRAVLLLGLDPSQVGLIPANVSARVLPKTLFGEKYIDLVLPADPSAGHIQDGAVIGEDRSTSALEVERVLADLFPLLRALEPEKLARALTSVADGLRDRGDQLGETLVKLDSLLASYDPSLDTFGEDLSGLADLAESLDDNAADLLRLAHNAAVSGRTITDKTDVLAQFLRGTADFSNTTADILEKNEQGLISLAKSSRRILEVVYAHRSELQSDVKGLHALLADLNDALDAGPALNIRLEIVPNRGAYTVADRPQYPEGNTASRPTDVITQESMIAAILGIPEDAVPDVAQLLWGALLGGDG